MRVFGVDPGSVRTGYGCVDSDGTRHQLVACGVLSPPARSSFPDRLRAIHDGLSDLLRTYAPECVAIETLFHARNVRSALMLAHARGVIVLASNQAGLPMLEYAPTEIKRAVTGYGAAEKRQLQRMLRLLLALDSEPAPHDAADALAVAICHAQTGDRTAARAPRHLRSWRDARLPPVLRRQSP